MRAILLSLMLLTTLSFFIACGEKKEAETETQQTEAMQAQEEQAVEGEMAESIAIDPVCGMKVNQEEAQFTIDYHGKTYYFCAEADKMAFLENPDKYLNKPEN
ncbi:MAG: YHS domain-containing protein [bacterium]